MQALQTRIEAATDRLIAEALAKMPARCAGRASGAFAKLTAQVLGSGLAA